MYLSCDVDDLMRNGTRLFQSKWLRVVESLEGVKEISWPIKIA